MTPQTIQAATAGSVMWDDHVKGLHLKVATGGTRSFYFYYRTKQGKQRRPKIGEFPSCSLADARDRARKLAARVAVGDDPKGDWEASKAELSVRELYGDVLAQHWMQERFQKSGWTKNVVHYYGAHIDRQLGSLKLSALTAAEVRRWHQGITIAHGPYAGNRALAVLSKMFAWAEEQELRPQGMNPCKLVRLNVEKKRTRAATADELKRAHAVLERLAPQFPAGAVFLWFLIFTGARPRAIERAMPEHLQEFELEGEPYGLLTLPGKTSETTGEDDVIVVPPPAMKALRWLRKQRAEGVVRESKTLIGSKMPHYLWAKIREEVGCHTLWARDFRRTFAVVGMGEGKGMDQIGEVLSHKSVQTTAIYARLAHDAKIKTSIEIARGIAAILKG